MVAGVLRFGLGWRQWLPSIKEHNSKPKLVPPEGFLFPDHPGSKKKHVIQLGNRGNLSKLDLS